MRRVLITGASGANGGAVLDQLLARGWAVAALLRDPAAWRVAGRLDRVTVIRGDMDDLPDVRADIGQFAADTIIHLAWDGVTSGSRNAPSQVHNLVNTIALLEMTAAAGAQHFIGFGSQAEYGSRTGVFKEDMPIPLGEVADQTGQVMRLEADVSALSRATGWRPETSLDTGLMQTVKWYRDNAS